jgi:hypothetical protein
VPAAVIAAHHLPVLLITPCDQPSNPRPLGGQLGALLPIRAPQPVEARNGQSGGGDPPEIRADKPRRATARRRTGRAVSSKSEPIPGQHAPDVFTRVMQLMGLERIVRVGGVDVAPIQPLAEPALDDVDVIHPT